MKLAGEESVEFHPAKTLNINGLTYVQTTGGPFFCIFISEGQHRGPTCGVVEESDTLAQYEGTGKFSNIIGGEDHRIGGGREGRDARFGSGDERARDESCCGHSGQAAGECGIFGWVVEDKQRDEGVASDSE